MTELIHTYAGEAMLLRWSETPKGRTVTLLLDPLVGETHPFKNLKCGENGQRMQLAAVLVGDDENPVPPPNTSTTRTPFKDLPRSAQAAIKCQDIQFRVWFCDLLPKCFGGEPDEISACDRELKKLLGITSKRELDTDEIKGQEWDRLLNTYNVRDLVRT